MLAVLITTTHAPNSAPCCQVPLPLEEQYVWVFDSDTGDEARISLINPITNEE
jgi:hypothetical protein